jgi:hypothetical protein
MLDDIADLITSDFEVPAQDDDWKPAIRRSAISVHRVLLQHPWASSLIESRVSAGPGRRRYLEAVIGALSGGGFAMPIVVRAIMLLDSYTYGFVLQERAWQVDVEDTPEAAASFARDLPADEYQNLLAMAQMVAAAPPGAMVDFEFGLDLILDGLERIRRTPGPGIVSATKAAFPADEVSDANKETADGRSA